MDQHISKDKLYREFFFPTPIYFFDHPTAKETNDKLKKDTETSVEENKKSSFGSGGVYVPQTG